uniref:Uncharacterized protein n=1 Tax=Glossina austeni TaxID=7395 RepID=A0A1A9V3I5_GLOAU
MKTQQLLKTKLLRNNPSTTVKISTATQCEAVFKIKTMNKGTETPLEFSKPRKLKFFEKKLNRVHALHNCSDCRSVIASDMCVVAENKDDVANYFHAHNPHSLRNLRDERTECGGGGDMIRPNGAGRISRISPGGTNGGGGKRIKGGGGPINGGGKNGGGGKRPIKGKVGASMCNGEGAPTISSPTPVEATFDPKKSESHTSTTSIKGEEEVIDTHNEHSAQRSAIAIHYFHDSSPPSEYLYPKLYLHSFSTDVGFEGSALGSGTSSGGFTSETKSFFSAPVEIWGASTVSLMYCFGAKPSRPFTSTPHNDVSRPALFDLIQVKRIPDTYFRPTKNAEKENIEILNILILKY